MPAPTAKPRSRSARPGQSPPPEANRIRPGDIRISEVICQILRINTVEKKTAGTQDTLLIRIRTDTGLEGIGEADASPEILKAIIDAPFSHNIACGLRKLLIGLNPLE